MTPRRPWTGSARLDSRQVGVLSTTPSTLGNALGEVAYLHCSWNFLLYPLKMSKQGRNLLFFLPLANNDISNHDSGKVLFLRELTFRKILCHLPAWSKYEPWLGYFPLD